MYSVRFNTSLQFSLGTFDLQAGLQKFSKLSVPHALLEENQEKNHGHGNRGIGSVLSDDNIPICCWKLSSFLWPPLLPVDNCNREFLVVTLLTPKLNSLGW